MDERRHSVDLPITRTLIALRRVRSLRDPSTNSMSKYSAMTDNLNWETNSYNNAITLGFQGDSDGNEIQVWRSSNFTEEDKNTCDPELYYGSRHCVSRSMSSETVSRLSENSRITTTQKSLHAKQLEVSPLNQEKSSTNNGPTGKCKIGCANKGLQFTPPMRFNNCIEGSGSCNDSDKLSKKNDRTHHAGSGFKRRRKKHDRLALITAGDASDESLCLSTSGQSRHSYDNEDVLAMDSCHQGCGIGSCWSRTPRFRELNRLRDVEERALLLENVGSTGKNLASKRKCEGVSPYTESPRSLCQKFMPRSFSELVGHSEVATSLLSSILNRKISSLYIFHGPRGTGKTSASRIFAAALNCLSSDISKPCCLCKECTLFFSGRSFDVKEMDSLKINKIERCRMLIKNARLPPVCSQFKVYIIDECQLLHCEIWDHILNSLEDLPPNVVFIMITPNLDKLPRNALLKSQKYNFQNLREIDITSRLETICVQEGLDFDQDALKLMANKSNGSLRDAEMMLDHLSLLGKKITTSLIYEVNGVVSDDELLDLLCLSLSCDATNTVKRARDLMSSRIDPLHLISQLANLIMGILAGKFPVVDSEAKRKLFGSDNSEAVMQQLSRALRILSQTEKQLRTSKNQSTWLTAALLQLSSSQGSLHDENGVRSNMKSINQQDGDFQSTSYTGESLKHIVACPCENIENAETGFQDLDFVWQRAASILTSRSLKKFLYKRGKLVSIRLIQGITVAEIEFDRPNHVAKAEKSWKAIASALQHILGYNVELRINLAQNTTNNHGMFKKPSFGLFSRSSRVHLKPQFSTEFRSVASENSDLTPLENVTRDKCVETCSSDCGSSHFSHACCHARELFKCIRNKDGNALSVAQNKALSPSGMTRENGMGTYRVNEGVSHFNQETKPRRRRMENLRWHCWRTAMFPFRKAWNLKQHQRTEHLVDYAVHYSAAN